MTSGASCGRRGRGRSTRPASPAGVGRTPTPLTACLSTDSGRAPSRPIINTTPGRHAATPLMGAGEAAGPSGSGVGGAQTLVAPPLATAGGQASESRAHRLAPLSCAGQREGRSRRKQASERASKRASERFCASLARRPSPRGWTRLPARSGATADSTALSAKTARAAFSAAVATTGRAPPRREGARLRALAAWGARVCDEGAREWVRVCVRTARPRPSPLRGAEAVWQSPCLNAP
eukprot:scaffold1312_cov393-Prasinococcus_capsulatus_cf.AAC.15